MSNICAILIILLLVIVIPISLITLVIRLVLKKTLKTIGVILSVSVGLIVPLAIIGVATAPATWCEHDYSVAEEISATCTEKGKTVYECSKCERTKTEKSNKLEHSMKEITNGYKCDACGYEEITEQTTSSLKDVGDEKFSESEKDKNNPIVSEKVEQQTDWKMVFENNGFSEEEILSYNEVLTNVGITDYHDVDVIENGRMHIVRGKIFDSEKLQLNLTLEDRKIIVVTLTGIPDYDYKPYITILGNLKFRKINTTTEIDLYYDMDGGYVAKLDWENNTILPYPEY